MNVLIPVGAGLAAGALVTWFVCHFRGRARTAQIEAEFTSRVELRQIGYDFTRGSDAWDVRERTLLSVYQTYSDYRFFDVRSSSETDKDGP